MAVTQPELMFGIIQTSFGFQGENISWPVASNKENAGDKTLVQLDAKHSHQTDSHWVVILFPEVIPF